MKKTRFLVRTLVALLLCCMLLSACASGGGSGAPSQAPAASGSQAASTPATGTENTGEPITVKWVTVAGEQSNPEPVMEEINKLLLERYNLQLDLEIFPYGTYDEKMNMKINSGEYFDLCFTSQAWINKYPVQVAKGAYLALDDYLDDYPALQEALPDFLFEQARINGKIYAVPNYQITYSAWGIAFRKDIVDEMAAAGIDWDYTKVTSYWEAEPFWAYVEENYPELIPSRVPYFRYVTDEKDGYIDVDTFNSNRSAELVMLRGDENYELVYPDLLPKEEQLEKNIGLWTEWTNNREAWEKGYLREDIATVQDETADIGAGRYASMDGTMKPGGEAELKKKSGNFDWVQTAVQTPFTNSVAARSAMTAVSAKSERPEAALKMLEVMNTDAEIFNLVNFGIEGANYDLVDGKVQQIDESGYFLNSAWALGNQFNALLMVNQADGIWEETDKINREAELTPLLGFSFNTEPVTNELAALIAVYKEYEKSEYMDNYEARYDEFIQKAGPSMEAIQAEAQAQLDAWLAENGMK